MSIEFISNLKQENSKHNEHLIYENNILNKFKNSPIYNLMEKYTLINPKLKFTLRYGNNKIMILNNNLSLWYQFIDNKIESFNLSSNLYIQKNKKERIVNPNYVKPFRNFNPLILDDGPQSIRRNTYYTEKYNYFALEKNNK